ncbi:MAG: ASCH domain-containing protein [bacterium]|nr:ASCH domain-containing protein [bacterium]
MRNTSIEKMWINYLTTINETPKSTNKEYYSWNFETSKEACNKLLQLVKDGKKTGTSCTKDSFDASDEVIPKIGDLHIITNWDKKAECIIKTTAVNFIPYKDVSSGFAKKEGEGDLSLQYWRDVHFKIYKREQESYGKKFNSDTLIVCEEFELIYK